MKQDGATATLEDVAREAGVSIATVSRALNAPDVVRQATRERVAAAVERTGYTPNFAGRALVLKRTMTVGAVIPTLDDAIFASGVNSFEATCRERGYTLLLAFSNYDAVAELTSIRRMLERGIDAMMLVGTDHRPDAVELLRKADKPFVCAWSYAPPSGLPTVGFDNRAAMADVVAHLTDLGHTDFGMVAGVTAGNDRARDRVKGVRAQLRRRGLKLSPKALVEARYNVDAGAEAAHRLLSADNPPTAIVCGNDVLAYGVLFAASACGVRVPKDLSVVGFDDLSLSARLPPGLTTVRVPALRMGEVAANHLADLVERLPGCNGKGPAELPTELVVRGSTAPPPRR
ncbi:MAG: LacI family DNA-binding transcriptional regulator [Pseudomonadota bacterium]